MHALARLIEDVKATNSWSNGDVSRRTGGQLARTRIQQLVTEPVKRVPARETVQGLAAGLGVPSWVVVDAYLEALGLPARPNSVSVEEAISADPQLSGDSKAMLRAMVAQARASAIATEAGRDAGSRATRAAPSETEDEQYLRYLRGDVGFDQLTTRRFEQRVQNEVPRAARRGESTADKMREAADQDAEGPDDPGSGDGV